MKYFVFILLLFVFCNNAELQPSQNQEVVQKDLSKKNKYSWLENYDIENKLVNRIPVPVGYKRIEVEEDSFEFWLRNIPLKKGSPDVYLYNGDKKRNQTAQFAVINIDVGNRDLQQCADATMRLRAEYLFASNQKNKIQFNFTSGDNCSYSKWKEGYRPKISGNNVQFFKSKDEDVSYKNFKNYLRTIFTYCGTFSLEKELKKVNPLSDIKAGDVFIMGGFPGHAVTVMDIATKGTEKIFLLSQSYMPAQDIHILKNPSNNDLSPWFSINFGETLLTPEWNFKKTSLKSF